LDYLGPRKGIVGDFYRGGKKGFPLLVGGLLMVIPSMVHHKLRDQGKEEPVSKILRKEVKILP